MLLDPPPVPLEIYRIVTLEASGTYTENLMLEHQPEEDAAHAAARDHNDRAGAELKNQTITVQNVIGERLQMSMGLWLDWIQVLTSCMACLIRGVSTGSSNMPENGGYSVKHSQQRGSYLYHSIRRAMDTPLEWSNTHLRYQVVAHIVRHVQFLFSLIVVHIQGNYGHLRISQTEYNDKRMMAQ